VTATKTTPDPEIAALLCRVDCATVAEFEIAVKVCDPDAAILFADGTPLTAEEIGMVRSATGVDYRAALDLARRDFELAGGGLIAAQRILDLLHPVVRVRVRTGEAGGHEPDPRTAQRRAV
jgi:hypothetical protein